MRLRDTIVNLQVSTDIFLQVDEALLELQKEIEEEIDEDNNEDGEETIPYEGTDLEMSPE